MSEIQKKGIAVLGSTGSLGRQAMDVIKKHSDHFFCELLYTDKNSELTLQQAKEFKPNVLVIEDEDQFPEINSILFSLGIKVFCGQDALLQALELEQIDIVFNAISGFKGIKSTIKTIEAGKTLALANKESMVVAGSYVRQIYSEKGGNIIPVDAEHSAIFQCIVGEFNNPIEKVIITSSGGPIWKNKWNPANVTPKQALTNPHWKMGSKISVDSATLLNKGFEIIEASWLYNLTFTQLEVLIHPESIIQSLVYFEDGSVKAQLSMHDMRIPIQYAFSFPERLATNYQRPDLLKIKSLNFEDPDLTTFPNLRLAYHAIEKAGNMPAILNAGNEIAVQAFLTNKIGFNDIFRINEKCMDLMDYIAKPDMTGLEETDLETRQFAKTLIY